MVHRLKLILRLFFYLPYSLLFNFYYFPLSIALRLPVLFFVRPTFLRLGGQVRLETDCIKTGMIKLGMVMAPIENYSGFRWQNGGEIIFKGCVTISHHSFISCAENAVIEIGGSSTFSSGCRIIAQKKIIFGDKARISWDCTFIDTDFHPIIDLVKKKTLPETMPIQIGYGVWIGHNSIVAKGTKLADNIIVGSGSVVKGRFTKTNTILGGNPCVVLDEDFQRDDT